MTAGFQAPTNAANGTIVRPAPFSGTGGVKGFQPPVQHPVPLQSPRPVRPMTLPTAHAWKPLKGGAFKIPKEPVNRNRTSLVHASAPKPPRLSSSLGSKR